MPVPSQVNSETFGEQRETHFGFPHLTKSNSIIFKNYKKEYLNNFVLELDSLHSIGNVKLKNNHP